MQPVDDKLKHIDTLLSRLEEEIGSQIKLKKKKLVAVPSLQVKKVKRNVVNRKPIKKQKILSQV